MGQVFSVYFGSRNRTLTSLTATLFAYDLKRRYGTVASLVSVVLYLSGVLQYRRYLTNGGIVRRRTMGPLKDMVVLDLSNGISGPACGTILGDLGAQVINVESVALPDHGRFLGAAVSTGMSGLFAHTGRGKQSIMLDLLRPKGQDVLKRLIKRCDVILVSNLSTALIEKLRVSYKEASRINESVIYFENVFVSSKNVKSYEPVLQAASGLASMMSNRLVPEAFCCKIGSITAAQAICSAVYARNKGAGGQYIRMDPLKCTLQYIWCDGFQSETFKQHAVKTKAVADWKKLYPNKKGEQTSFLSLESARNMKSFKENIKKGNHFIFGEYRYARFPAIFEKTPVVAQQKDSFTTYSMQHSREPAPMMGEHTTKILKELNYENEQIRDLYISNVATSTSNFLKEKNLGAAADSFKWIELLQEGNTFANSSVKEQNPDGLEAFAHGPLTGIKVIEICTRIGGPLAAQIVADQGATVIKLEVDKDLDPARKLGPMGKKKMGAIFANCNRNKYSKTIKCSGKMKRKGILNYIIGKNENLLLEQYFRWADVVLIDEEKERAMSLTHDRVKSINPNVIYVPIRNEKSEMFTQGLLGQCYQDVISKSILAGELPGHEAFINMPINAKYLAAFVAAVVSATLVAKSSPSSTATMEGNNGQKVDISSLGLGYYMSMFDKHINYTWLKTPFLPDFPELYELSGIFTCSGGEKIAMYIPMTERDWDVACVHIIVPAMENDGSSEQRAACLAAKLWDTNKTKWSKAPFDRITHISDVEVVVRHCISKFTMTELKSICLKNNLSFALVKSVNDVVNPTYAKAITHKKLGTYSTPAFAVDFSRTPCTLRKASPMKDEDKDFVLDAVGAAKTDE